jgi:hypothetical protein
MRVTQCDLRHWLASHLEDLSLKNSRAVATSERTGKTHSGWQMCLISIMAIAGLGITRWNIELAYSLRSRRLLALTRAPAKPVVVADFSTLTWRTWPTLCTRFFHTMKESFIVCKKTYERIAMKEFFHSMKDVYFYSINEFFSFSFKDSLFLYGIQSWMQVTQRDLHLVELGYDKSRCLASLWKMP